MHSGLKKGDWGQGQWGHCGGAAGDHWVHQQGERMMDRILSRCPSTEICVAGVCETSTACRAMLDTPGRESRGCNGGAWDKFLEHLNNPGWTTSFENTAHRPHRRLRWLCLHRCARGQHLGDRGVPHHQPRLQWMGMDNCINFDHLRFLQLGWVASWAMNRCYTNRTWYHSQMKSIGIYLFWR